jgi:KUP system potassium uptake protein
MTSPDWVGRNEKRALGRVGVAFGDIGTNVLFAIRAAFQGSYSVSITEQNVLGFLSLVFWALVLIVCVKYLGFFVRADNHGEGGIVALMELVIPQRHRPLRKQYARLMVVGSSAPPCCMGTVSLLPPSLF